MLRTWAVRLLAIRLTLSVRSFHVPATPRTWAWPPSFPSVPTSRATRVTSEAKEFNWSTMVLMVYQLNSFASRSEEHTSELQSRGHLVCRLLLEKKKKNYILHHEHEQRKYAHRNDDTCIF